jgi:hypothetical protein
MMFEGEEEMDGYPEERMEESAKEGKKEEEDDG